VGAEHRSCTFFFQAEDGIRDDLVTGVQTCALPISKEKAYIGAMKSDLRNLASSAVARLRRSDFIAPMYAFSFVLANFGIAIAARIPMITTTIKSSISVKPRRPVTCVPSGRQRAPNPRTHARGPAPPIVATGRQSCKSHA